MKPTLARLLTRVYPRIWRERYGTEFEALLIEGRGDLRTLANVVCSAVSEYIFPTQAGNMDKPPVSFGAVIRQPSAFLPLWMSLSALGLVMIHIAIFGAAREPDEETTAHLWQILMAGQLPILAFFAIKWLPRAPRQSLYVLGLQVGAVLASMAPVLYFNL
jgi:hypothetical protein